MKKNQNTEKWENIKEKKCENIWVVEKMWKCRIDSNYPVKFLQIVSTLNNND